MPKFSIYNSHGDRIKAEPIEAANYLDAYQKLAKRGLDYVSYYVVKFGDYKYQAVFWTPDTLKHNPH